MKSNKRRPLDRKVGGGRIKILLPIFLSSIFLSKIFAADVTLPYSVPKAGRVSLAVYNTERQLVRTLLTGKPHSAGQYTQTWDGRDRYGNPLPVGPYTWKMVQSQGLITEYLLKVGANANPEWEKGCSTDSPARSAAIDETGVYRFAAHNELGRHHIKTDLNGKYLWAWEGFELKNPWAPGGEGLTLLDGKVFEVKVDGTVYGYSAETGHCMTSGDYDPKPWNVRWDGSEPPEKNWDFGGSNDMAGDIPGNLLVLSYTLNNGIQWFNAKDGKRVDRATGIPRPTGIATGADGTVFVISEGAVVKLTRADKKPQVVIPADQLRYPFRLSVERKSGDIFVAEASDLVGGKGAAPHHQIQRFSKDGRKLRSYGSPAGRQDGIYVPTDFKRVLDIEADQEGGFLITEGNTPPRRTARFGKDGNLLREWIGGQENAALVSPEPDNPRFVWMHANAEQRGLLRCEVDYEKRTWRVAEIYQDVFQKTGIGAPGSMLRTTKIGGRLYIFGEIAFPIAITHYDPENHRVRLVVHSGMAFREGKWRIPEHLRPTDGSKPSHYLWTDLNDDGLASREEMQWLPHAVGGAMDATDLTLYTGGDATGFNAGNKLTPAGFTPGGTPKYVFDPAIKHPAWVENGETFHIWDIRRDEKGDIYGCFSDGFPGWENHGAWFFNSSSGIDRLVKWDKDWKPLWSVGRHSPDDEHDPGSTAMPRNLVGTTHGCVIWADSSDEEVAQPTAWTEDGLYVDELMRQPGDTTPEIVYGIFNQREYPHNNLYTNPKTGEVLYYAVNVNGSCPIFKLTGWDKIQRKSGKLTLTTAPPAIAHNGAGLTAQYFNTPDLSGEAVLTRVEKDLYNDGTMPDAKVEPAFSARWSGQLEAPATDEYRIVVEGNKPWKEGKDPAWTRLWVDGRLLLDTANGRAIKTPSGHFGRVKLEAGRKIDIVLECGFKQGKPAVHLCWETATNERRRIQQKFLHPKTAAPVAQITRSQTPGESDPLRPELIAHFPFEEGSGILTRSATSANLFDWRSGNVTWSEGKTSKGLTFTAAGPFEPALLPIDNGIRIPATDYSVAFWFKTTSTDGRLFCVDRDSSWNNIWTDHVIALEDGKLRVDISGDKPIFSPTKFNDGQWHQLISTLGGASGAQKLYVDGHLVAEGKATHRELTTNRNGIDLGPDKGNCTVSMDELRIYGRSLTGAEVQAITQSN